MELKYTMRPTNARHHARLNRTFMELKSCVDGSVPSVSVSLNRTFMELKYKH